MRRLATFVAVLGAALSFGFAVPPEASACTGCATSFREFVDATDSIVLARSRGRTGQLSIFEVIDVLKGPPAHTLRLKMWDDLGKRQRPGTRWLLTPAMGVSMDLFRVDPDGTVTNLDGGEGFVESPSTLAGWYQALGLPQPDTSTAAAPSSPAPPRPAPALPVAMLLVGSLIGVTISLRRLEQPRPVR